MNHPFLAALICAVLSLFASVLNAAEVNQKPLGLKLPTENLGLINGEPEKFYMYVDRTTDGVASRPWSGGKFGYWRTLIETSEGPIASKFHEGIDIAPVQRDSAGRPLDIVHSIADGTVVHISNTAGHSSYGKYVVVKHDWGYGDFYSLYAHLASANCILGQKVRAESPLGRLGYTGVGINLRRAHLHLELGIMFNDQFERWHKKYYTGKNYHGKYNGMNICGLDIAGLLLSNHMNPRISIPQFLKNIPVQYKVTIPRKGDLQICQRYLWMKKGNHAAPSASWEISFSSGAFPLSVAPSDKVVRSPIVSSAEPLPFNQKYRTRKLTEGNSKTAKLTALGLRNIDLIAGTFIK
ncbi:M23 family metallopeptidase [Akkermansiaceae bacterium]|nr:M23 family metallopeptidase [Akkermansiaceae bacterium]